MVLNVDSRQLVDVNQSAVELFGRGRDPLLSANLLQLAPEQQPDGRFSATVIWDQVNLALQGELPVFEWTVFGPNQEPIMRTTPGTAPLIPHPPHSLQYCGY